jgi:hypothetical protein
VSSIYRVCFGYAYLGETNGIFISWSRVRESVFQNGKKGTHVYMGQNTVLNLYIKTTTAYCSHTFGEFKCVRLGLCVSFGYAYLRLNRKYI